MNHGSCLDVRGTAGLIRPSHGRKPIGGINEEDTDSKINEAVKEEMSPRTTVRRMMDDKGE